MNFYKQIRECESYQRIWETDLSDWILFWSDYLRFNVLEHIFPYPRSVIRSIRSHNPLTAMLTAFQLPILIVKVHLADRIIDRRVEFQ